MFQAMTVNCFWPETILVSVTIYLEVNIIHCNPFTSDSAKSKTDKFSKITNWLA